MTQLRDYQTEAVQAVYDWFQAGKGNPLVVAPTGSGKSVILSEFCRRALADYPVTRIVVATHVKELVQQNAAALLRLWPAAPVGIYSAGLGSRQRRQITFAGIQSVARKAAEFGFVDLLLVDEAHLLPRNSDTQYQTFIAGLTETNPNLRVIGLTATPFRLDSGRLDRGHGAIFDGIAYDIPIPMLVKRGYLAPLISKRPGQVFDTAGLHTRGGDYIESEMVARFDTESVTRAAVQEVVAAGQDRRSWLLFCISVEHAAHVRDEVRRHGIAAEMVTGATPADERARILAAFKDGRIRALSNVNVLCLDSKTEILTSDGFVGIDDMTMQHSIAGWRQDGSIEWAPPKLIVRRQLGPDEKMIRFGNGMASPIRVTGNHRMVVRCGSGRGKSKVVSAESLIGKRCSIPSFGHCDPEPFINKKKGRGYSAARVRALSYEYRKKGMSADLAVLKARERENTLSDDQMTLPNDLSLAECKLIGFWLGDGSRSGGRIVISQSMRYPDNVAWLDGVLSETGIRHSRHVRQRRDGLSADAIIWDLAKGTGGLSQSSEKGWQGLDGYLDKDGSPLLRYLSRDQLTALLDGFWRADGNHHSKGRPRHRYVVGTQRSLYDALQSLCVTRGISASIHGPIAPRQTGHSVQWRFSWGGRQNWCYPSAAIREDAAIEGEMVWCVTSSTSFLICRRGGKVFVTGNTTGFDAPATDLLAFLRPTQSLGLYMQMAGRAMRVAPGKDNGLVLDFSGNVARHGPVDAVSVSDAREKGPGAKREGEAQAPAKTCPECQSILWIGTRQCPDCGHEFPEPEPKIEKRASTEAIMNLTAEDDWRAVADVSFRKHVKGDVASLRVEYLVAQTGIRGVSHRVVSEFVCLEHGGFPRQKAVQWWHRSAGTSPPDTVDEALARIGEVRVPEEVVVRKEGEFWRITRTRGEAGKGVAA